MLPTFADLGRASLPTEPALDGRSFAPKIRNEAGGQREWVYVQHNTAHEWYVLERGWKLTQAGELFDMSDAPFAETQVSPGEAKPEANAARARLGAVLARLNPAAGKLAPIRTAGELSKKAKKKQRQKAGAAKAKAANGSAPAPDSAKPK
jgi:hypothetical protein